MLVDTLQSRPLNNAYATSFTPNTSPNPPAQWQTNLGQAIPAALGAAQQYAAQNTSSKSSGKPTFSQGLYNQYMGNFQPEMSQLMSGAEGNMGLYNSSIAGIQGGMGPTDISELKRSYGKLMGQDIYQSYDKGLNTLSDYRSQLGRGTTAADVTMGRQLKEAERGMALQPGMTAAQRGAASFSGKEKAAEGAYGSRLSEYGQATGALAQGQMGRSQLESQNIQAAGNLAAQMSGFRSQDLSRIIAGNVQLAQLAMTNPKQAALLAIMQLKQGAMQNASGSETQSSSGGGTFNKVLGVASVAAPIIIAI